MSDELDDIVDNLQEPSAWIRILFMLGYALLLYLVIVPVLFVLGLVQALFAIVTGEDNEKLRGLGGALAEYVHQLLSFFTYNTDEMPFPFKDFPEFTYGESTADSDSASSKSTSKKTTAKKTTKKKTAKKKTASKKKSTASKKSKSDADSEDSSGNDDKQAAND